ncbi:Indian hedgehog protein [Schistosoma japonicum]|uniref:Indian hedgehog protein n=1 Tax=Schistosoma japonicum TaxID=6182 RepID=A0A4Z2CUP5_SCHJA|nr:Indian hedgehog protein [Schistosoma japonicum]
MHQINYLLLITLFLILIMNILEGCMKSSMFYRTPIRSRSHVFAPGEYQPKQLESNVEASGPLDTRDFHYQIPTKRLVRVDSPYIIFDSEEARWMTKGCRDRLIKLSTQIHNTWAKQEVILRVIRSWVKPPANYKILPQEDNLHENHEDSPLLYEKNFKSEKFSHDRDSVFVEHASTVFSGQKTLPFVPVKSKPYLDAPIIDMTPEMMDGEFIEIPSKGNKLGTQSNGLQFHQYIPSSKSISTQKNRWPPTKNNPNYITHFSSLPKSSISLNPTKNQRSHQSLSSSSSSPSSSGYFYNPNKVTSSLPDTSYDTMIRLPRNVFPTKINISNYNVNQTNNEINQNDQRLHKLIERSVNTMHAPNTDRKHRNHDLVSNQNHLLTRSKMNELRMEEFHYAGRAVDMELITRQYGRPRNSDLHLGVLAQIAYYVAHFDWCFVNRAGHVHCSVKPDSIVTSQWFGCFHGESKVYKMNGQLISMKDLQIGDRILTQNPINKHLQSTLVFGFLDRDEHALNVFTEIHYQINSNLKQYGTIQLTNDHLIFVYDNSTITKQQHNHTTQLIDRKAIFASSVKKDQLIFVYTTDKQMIKAQVISIHTTTIQPYINNSNNGNSIDIQHRIGLYAPITDTGTMIVDNVLVSCFAHISNHNLASIIIWPWRLMYVSMSCVYDIFNKFFQFNQYNNLYWIDSYGVPWFLQLIYRFIHFISPESLFYR